MRLVIAPGNFWGKPVIIDAFSVYLDCILNEKQRTVLFI